MCWLGVSASDRHIQVQVSSCGGLCADCPVHSRLQCCLAFILCAEPDSGSYAAHTTLPGTQAAAESCCLVSQPTFCPPSNCPCTPTVLPQHQPLLDHGAGHFQTYNSITRQPSQVNSAAPGHGTRLPCDFISGVMAGSSALATGFKQGAQTHFVTTLHLLLKPFHATLKHLCRWHMQQKAHRA